MQIKSLCELLTVYNAIYNFFIESGYGEQPDLTPHPTLTYFIGSYSQLNHLLSVWETKCK